MSPTAAESCSMSTVKLFETTVSTLQLAGPDSLHVGSTTGSTPLTASPPCPTQTTPSPRAPTASIVCSSSTRPRSKPRRRSADTWAPPSSHRCLRSSPTSRRKACSSAARLRWRVRLLRLCPAVGLRAGCQLQVGGYWSSRPSYIGR